MLNNVILMGRITHDLELKGTQNGKNYLRFSIAITRKYSKEREKQVTDFINCMAWEKTAEFIYKYFEKGRIIAVCGSIQTNNFTDKNGNNQKSVSVLVNQVNFCGESKKEDCRKNSKNNENTTQNDMLDDDFIPF